MTARVGISEGYVLTHKFDQMSQERPLLEVVSVFNELCIMIREKRTKQDLLAIANNLTEVFGTDFSMLAQLLPNINALSLPKLTENKNTSGVRINIRSVCFIL